MTYTYFLSSPSPSVNAIYANVSEKMRAALAAKGKRAPEPHTRMRMHAR